MSGTHPDLLGHALRSIVEEALEPLTDRVAAVEDTQQRILKEAQGAARRSRSGSGAIPKLDLDRTPPWPCRCCGGLLYWRRHGDVDRATGPWICRGCHPSDLREEQVEVREVEGGR